MKSPFPGMDPYLERHWQGVHGCLIVYMMTQLQKQMPENLRVRIEQELIVEELEVSERFRPDLQLVRAGGTQLRISSGTGGVQVAEPAAVVLMSAPRKHRWLKVIDIEKGNQVVTVVELLSRSNKRGGKGNRTYRKQLRRFREGGVSVVEIDFIRSIDRSRLELSGLSVPKEKSGPYLMNVRRGWRPDEWVIYTGGMRERLPAIPVPLQRDAEEAVLDLQPLIDQVYVDGRYDDIDYSKPLRPPLSPEDQVWLSEQVTQRR